MEAEIMCLKRTGRFLQSVLTIATLVIAATHGMLQAEDNAVLPGTKCPKKIAVLAETVTPAVFQEYRYFSGQGQTEIVAVKTPVSGLLSEIKVSEGSLVDAGQELAIMNAGMGAEIKKLEAAAAKAKKILIARQNWKEKSEKAIQNAEKDYQTALDLLNQKKAQADLIVKAPVAGIVHLVMAAGTETVADALLLEIGNPRQMIFSAPLADADKGLLAVGEKLIGTTAGLNAELEAEVVAVSETLVTFRVNNEAGQVKDGVSFTFKKFIAEHIDAITVPTPAVQKDSLGDFVYVLEKKKAKKLYVTLGAAANGKTVVAKGLASGAMLVVSGFECLVDGKPVRIVNQEELAKEKAKAVKKEKEAIKAEKKPVEPEVKAEKTEESEKIEWVDKGLFRVGLTFERFTVNDKNYHDFYKNKFQHIPGIEFSYQVAEKIDVWAAARYYSDSEPTEYFKAKSTFTLIPISLGARFRPVKGGFLEPFIGAGVNFYLYSEKISEESSLEPTSGSAFGFHFQGGSYFYVSRSFLENIFAKHHRLLLGEIFVKYNIVKKTLAEELPVGTDKFDIGGIEIGIGLVVKF
jgi:RND family efflux transporter MFP subunit